ncbi:MAG: peptide chain release factor N(5)-glutamine methyltransferase, partial [Proteobacteria bacterium]|nr:peptide chain release factor N(5)-glutamine methyltransferase [Pseudomonadota bacterium]
MNKIWTILELINETTGYFKKKSIESARLDAELLLAHCLNIERIQLYIAFERALTEAELSLFRDMVRRRAAGEPVAYLTGYREFWSLKIKVQKGVLIPRPETEL